MANQDSLFAQFISGRLGIVKRGQYLVKYASPLFCAETLMQSIASEIAEISNGAADGETAEEAVARFKVERAYVEVLDYFMSQMEREIMPALGRLRKLQQDGEDG